MDEEDELELLDEYEEEEEEDDELEDEGARTGLTLVEAAKQFMKIAAG